MLIHVIADYGPGDLAFAEVVQRLKANLLDAEPMTNRLALAMLENSLPLPG